MQGEVKAMRVDHFSMVAPLYDQLAGFQDSSRLRDLLALPTGGRLLDAGGGTGRVSAMLRGLARQIVVIDLSPGMLRQANRKNGLAPVRAEVEQMPFPSGSFDRILVVDAFHHFCDQGEAAAELWRVLAPGGRLVVEEPNVETWPARLVALGERLALMRSQFYTPADVGRMFEALGGRVEVDAGHPYNAWVVVRK